MSQSATTTQNGASRKAASKPAKATKTEGKDALNPVEALTKASFSTFSENVDTVRAQTEDMVKTVQSNFETANERLQSANADMMNAAREEMSEAMTFANDLAGAKTIADAMEIQRDYWTNLFETRMDRAREMTEVSVSTTREMFEPMSETLSNNFQSDAFEKLFPFAKTFASK